MENEPNEKKLTPRAEPEIDPEQEVLAEADALMRGFPMSLGKKIRAVRGEPEIDLEQEVLDEAFTLTPGDPLALEKKIRSVALLLEELTKEGNEPVSGAVAYGFAEILRDAAEDAARLRKELHRLHET